MSCFEIAWIVAGLTPLATASFLKSSIQRLNGTVVWQLRGLDGGGAGGGGKISTWALATLEKPSANDTARIEVRAMARMK